ncbi:MAG: MBOAT family O-acyltransferase [Chthoniobacterales bacterium]
MLFHSFGFFLFFWIVFGVYWRLREHERRMRWLLAASIIFYGLWSPWFVLLIAFTAGADYLIALQIEAAAQERARRAWLVLSLVVSLSLLAFFKYAHFMLEAGSGLLALFGFGFVPPAFDLVLPLGISFYTFETISYVVDVYRGRVRAERNVFHYALYIMFFPHLIAGPIVRPSQFLWQIRTRKHFDWARLQFGAQLFLRGLLKKAVFADRLALVVDPIFRAPGEFSSATLWLGTVAYAVQVYCDFAGYTDMARGVAQAFGFKLPINFDRPYLAASVGEFWRRWHITLSSWVRDYLYIPLGGSRDVAWKTYRNLIFSMVILGLWHGAGWNFIVFGLYHGVLLSLERAFPLPAWTQRGLPRLARIGVTFTVVCFGLVIFRNPSLAGGAIMLQRMLQPLAGATLPLSVVTITLVIIGLIFAGHVFGRARLWRDLAGRVPAPLVGVAMACLFLLIQLLIPEDGGTFIYFQF